VASSVAQLERGSVGRPRKHQGGWQCANKRICFANETFEKWRHLKTELGLVNDNAVACHLLQLEAEQRLNGSKNKELERERFSGSIIHYSLIIIFGDISCTGEFQPSPPVLSSTPIVESHRHDDSYPSHERLAKFNALHS